MALIKVSQISLESEVCGGKMAAFLQDIIADLELKFGQWITHDKIKLVYSLLLC